MGRRGENIRKRGDGRWEARIITGYDSGQRAVYHSVYGKTYSEVKKKRIYGWKASLQRERYSRKTIRVKSR